VDTRNKILSPAAVRRLPLDSPAVATGYFDVILAGHARDLDEVRARAAGRALVVIVLPLAREILSQSARAELVAALRVVDYVVIADDADLESLIAFLNPSELVRLEAADADRARQLREHVRCRRTRDDTP
jgi:bifunctional ADP-heptose synthase (sugar kinase/adenylyltransferase)